MTGQTAVLTIVAVVLILVLAERAGQMFRPRPSLLDRPVVFFLVVFGAILVLRWPEIVWPQGINLDEAQTFAQAMRFCAHPMPWRDVDGNTSGPLTSMLLSLPLRLGAPAAWPTARVLLWTANCLTVVFLYLALRVFGTRSEAQFVLTPVILFYAFALDPNFAHYSNETLPVLLISAGFFILAREWDAPRPSRAGLFFLGLIAGSLPFTKLQAGPLGFFLFATGLACLIAKRRGTQLPGRTCWLEAGVLCLGAVTTSALLLGWVAASGAISDFWISYILQSRAYTQKISAAGRMANIRYLFTTDSDFRPYLLCAMLACLVLLGAFFTRKAGLGRRLFWPLAWVLADGVLTFICILMAGQAFLHYLLLLVPVLAVFIGLAFLAGRRLLGCGEGPGQAAQLSRWFLVASFLVMVPQTLRSVQYVRDVAAVYPRPPTENISAIADCIRPAGRPGDALAIWGWMPSYYVETGLMPATRDAVSDFAITAGPYRDYFQARFLGDLKRSRPAFFIDAVSDGAFLGPSWRRADAHEGFPELAAYVDENYSLWWSVHLTEQGVPVRIYALKSRMAELHLSPNNVKVYAP
jgi:hypothetical protein